jgi:hypothetical protein
MSLSTFGYFEYRRSGADDWQTDSELPTMVRGRDFWQPLVGIAGASYSGDYDGEPVAPDRGIPDDASETVAADYDRQQIDNPVHGGSFRTEFGHSHLSPTEIPEEYRIDTFDRLYELADEYGPDNARLVVWFDV